MQPHIETTIRFLTKSSNPSSIDLLRFLLKHIDRDVREKAFEGLYLKQDSSLLLELFHLVSHQEQKWFMAEFLTPERMSRLAEEAIRNGDFELARCGCDMAVRNKLYEVLPAISTLLEVLRPEWVELAAEIILKLATCFYNQLADAASDLERRNMDRRREWFAAQLESPVRRYAIHGRIEPVKAFLLVAKKNYPFLLKVLGDVHSQVCKTVVDLLQNNAEGSYHRLLLSFVSDANSPPVIDLILTSREDPKFISHLLKMIGTNPSQNTRDAIKRFKAFRWIFPGNKAIPELIAGEEEAFVQLVAHTALPRETALAMFELIFKLPSVGGHRAAIKAIRAFHGDDVNRILIGAACDSDPCVCSEALRIMKAKRIKEVDQIIMLNCDHPSPLVRETIYDLMPEFRIETFFQKIGLVTETMAHALGKIVRSIDPQVRKRINEEIASAIPVRRRMAIDATRFTDLAPEYEELLIHFVEKDNEIEVRIAACMALAQVLTTGAWQTLQHAAASRNLAMQRAGAEASERWQNNVAENQREMMSASVT